MKFNVAFDNYFIKVNWMKYSPPTKDNITKHREFFKDTFNIRRRFIKGKTITDIIQVYPRFEDLPELVNMNLYSQQENLIRYFTIVCVWWIFKMKIATNSRCLGWDIIFIIIIIR